MIRQPEIGVEWTFGGRWGDRWAEQRTSGGRRQSPMTAHRKPIMMKKPVNIAMRASAP
jgi:hypothetical protein